MMTLAIMALLMGGLAFNANAQDKTAKTNNKQAASKEVVKKASSTSNVEKMLGDYEAAVKKCVSMYNALQQKNKTVKADPKEFDQLLANAEKLKAQLEQTKGQMDRTQLSRFKLANDNLAKVYKKS